MMDFETAAKTLRLALRGAEGGLARMERALGQFMLDLHTEEHGYTEVQPPLLVRDDAALYGDGASCRKFAEDRFTRFGAARHAAEVSALAHPHRRGAAHQPRPRVDPRRGRAAAPLHRADAVLPLRGRRRRARTRAACCASISSTRSSWSRSPRRNSRRDEHERMLTCAEEVLKRLDLHYRVMMLCDRRHGLRRAEDLRHRGLAAGAGGLSRDLVLLGLRRFPGAAHAGALPAERTARARASSTR